jgi:hypothetical protein
MSLTLSCDAGKAITWDVVLTRGGAPLALPTGTKLWFTVKLTEGAPDASAVFQLTEAAGITQPNPGAGRIRLRASAAQTAALSALVTYYCELQYLLPGEDPDIPDDGRGTLTVSTPVTAANA